MRAYIIRRLLLMIPTLFLVTLIVFFSVRFIPGSVIDLMVIEMSEQARGSGLELTEQALRERLGLDVPAHIQYGRWLAGVVQGDLGTSLRRGTPVTEMILHRLPVSIELALLAVIIGLLIALPIGIYSAVRQDTWGDYLGRTIAILSICLPSFWIGTMIIVYPSIWWNWMPSVEHIPFVENPAGNLLQFILPSAILGMVLSGITMRMMRTMMLEVMRQDYIRTAWAKGLTEQTIIVRHAMKNAIIPVVTIVGVFIPAMIGGTIIVEQIFSLPGVGLLLIEALTMRDYPIISGINLVLACAVLVFNLLVDIAYAYLDPRVQY